MRLVYSYKKLNLELLDMIEKANKYIYIFSWNFNIHYNRRMEEAIINATRRGVYVYLMTGGVEDNPVFICRMKGINEQFFHVKYKFQIGSKRPENVLQIIFRTIPSVNYMYYNHMRFALNDETFLLGGMNSSSKYNGNLKRNMNTKYPFTWYDSGLKMKASPEMERFINNLYSNMDYEMLRAPLFLSNESRLVHDNYDAYQEIINAIRGSKNKIHIDNQYFISCPGYTNNKIAYELGKRINKAIQSGDKDFRLQLLLNYINYDEVNVIILSMNAACIGSLQYMRSLVDCDDETFYKHVRIYMPRDDIRQKIVVHNKLFIIDDSFCLYTSANIHDLSLSRKGNMELGFLTKCPDIVDSLYKQSIAYFHKHKTNFFQYSWNDSDIVTTITKIPEVIHFLLDDNSDKIEFDTNCVVVADTLNNCISPVCKLLIGQSILQFTGALLPLT
jgi:phosphatidylserine/phosphatidylglycerophosphate/cardiolipin synthase-like enzyme